MDWSNERYVRVYVRDTPDWLLLSWEARALWLLLLRKLDRAGVMDLGRHGAKGVAAAVGMPVDVVERALPELLEDGCIVVTKRDALSVLVAPNYLEAQEAVASDAQRKRESRSRRRERSLIPVTKPDAPVTNRPGTVTRGHEVSRAVTSGHSVPSLAVPDQAMPDRGVQGGDPLAAGPPATPAKREGRKKPKPSDPTPEEEASIAVVLGKLNDRTGRGYKPRHDGRLTGNARYVLALLRKGYSEDDLRVVVWERANRWADDPKMSEYLQPSTLFGPEKFDQRLANARAAAAAVEARANGARRPPPGAVLDALAKAQREG